MKIALVDVDSRLPNLALMRLSAWHKAQGDEVLFPWRGQAVDKLCASVVFTWHSRQVDLPWWSKRAAEVQVGGSGWSLEAALPPEVEAVRPDYSLYGIDYGIGYTVTPTTAGGGGKSQLVSAFLAKYHGPKTDAEARGQILEEPIKTVDTANRFALVASHIIKLRGTSRHGQPITEPIATVTAGGLHLGVVRAFLLKYYGTNVGQPCDDPLQTVTTKHRFGLVTVEGQEYRIVDIGLRMLEPHELFAAQGFPPTYIMDRDDQGHRFTKSAKVAMCGNAVPPQLSEALVRTNLPEMCGHSVSRWPEVVREFPKAVQPC
ncbi:MAG: DNA cytosine methyltransferase [Thermaerobacter sp.]|nr:DNA cytosine methyltransferase [Thermaerobacter sp.]